MELRRLVSRGGSLFDLVSDVWKGRLWRTKFARGASGLRNGRDRVLEYQLFLRAGFHNQRKLVEALDATQQLGSIHQIDRDGDLLAPREIEKPILDVLWRRL
jgi:hypothetical protein